VITHRVGVYDERMLIRACHVAKAQEPARIPEIALVGGAGGAREHLHPPVTGE
jgi:hypothetical protein